MSSLILVFAYAFPSLKQSSYLLSGMTITALLSALALTYNAWNLHAVGGGLNVLGGTFEVTPITLLIGAFIITMMILVYITLPNIITNQLYPTSVNLANIIIKYQDYLLIGVFSSIGSLLLLGVNSIIVLYLAVELQSFGVYILAAMNKVSEPSTGAGLKYFLLGSLASCFILLGLIIIYAETGLTLLSEVYNLYNVSGHDMPYVDYGLTLVVLGLLFKIAAAPLHYWAPDVYSDTPTSITVWLTIMPKIAIVILLYHLTVGFGLTVEYGNISVKQILLVSSALSLIIGSVLGLSQTRVKRLLAYSTISHVGFLLLILAISTEESTSGLLFYLVQYSLTNLLVFLVLLFMSYSKGHKPSDYRVMEGGDVNYIVELQSLMTKNYWLGLAFVIALFSMAGIPPLPGFFAKQSVILAAAQVEYYFMALLCIVVSVISATYYLKLITMMYTTDNSIGNNTDNVIISSTLLRVLRPTSAHTYLIATLAVLLVAFILNSSLILNTTQLASLAYYG